MKLRHFYPCLILAGMAVTMASCSEEAVLPSGQGRNVTLTVNISRVGDNTRAILTEEAGNLVCTWEDTDHILVVDAAGNKLGVLDLKSGAGASSATFSGVINTDATDEANLNFLYLGNKTAEQLNALPNPVEIDYSAQDGSLQWLYSNDFFTGSEKVKIVSNIVTLESVSLSRQISFGKFEIELPSGVTYGGEDITVSGEGINTKASVSMTDGSATFGTPGSITVTRPDDETSPSFYLTVLPGTIIPTFSVTIGGKTYSCTLEQRTWAASVFKRKDNLDGTYSGIKLAMTAYTNPYEGYENEDPRNPLHKFAKYNLTRGENNLNVFVDESDKYGALYQWGRYYGFIDVKSNSGFGKYTLTSTKYSQFAEALGNRSNNGSWDSWDYSVYDSKGQGTYRHPGFENGETMYEYVAIVAGLNYSWSSWTNSGYFDYQNIYSSKDEIVTDRPHYMMDGDPDKHIHLQGQGSARYKTYVDEFSNSADYWVSDFDTETLNGGDKWGARAAAQGFTEDKRNPCPTGWRLPSADEMAEILPENGLYEKDGNLADMLNKYSELRKTRGGTKYAIRWNYGTSESYIEIECVVVDDSYTNVNQLTDTFWDEHRTDKVVRRFPFTGGIRPYTGVMYGSSTWDSMVCRPVSMGKPVLERCAVGYIEAIGLISINETGGVNNHFGGYWVDEKGLAMKFCSENFEREVNGNVRETESEYTRLRIEETGPAFGMAIRPVMDLK